MNASLIKYQCLNVFVTICLFIAELISRLLNAFVIFNVRMLTAVLTNVSKSSHKSTWILFGFSDCFELNETYSLVDDFTWNIRPISWKTRSFFSSISIRFHKYLLDFFLVCQSDDDEILDYYIVKVVTIACEFRISINTTTLWLFFYFLRFFCYFSQIIEIHGKIISFAYRGGLMWNR